MIPLNNQLNYAVKSSTGNNGLNVKTNDIFDTSSIALFSIVDFWSQCKLCFVSNECQIVSIYLQAILRYFKLYVSY
jgi:hypothetical protein